MSAWLYKQTERPESGFPGLWTVGFYDPDGTWHPESDHNDPEQAAARVRWLSGGDYKEEVK